MAMLPAAERVAASLSVPTNAVLAQWAYESGWGNSKLAKDGNNFGGIKTGGSSWKGQKISLPSKEKDGTEIAVSSFRKYESPEAYADDFIAFLGKPRYKNVKGAESAEDYAMRLGKAGYHQDTDGKYAKQIASIAKKLDQFSQPGFNRSLASNLQ
jgi:flagellum-specific peptidoglycan hydrolase FlgJ